MKPANIVLIGFMGTGKSTVGKELAARLSWAFTDTDELVERQQGTTISELFRVHGEAHFRALESAAIEEALAEQGHILSTGGGAVLAESNRACMLRNGFVVALKAAPEVIIRRVSSDQSRPLLQGDLQNRVHTLLEQRKHAYDFAHLTIDTSSLSVEQIAALILAQSGLAGAADR